MPEYFVISLIKRKAIRALPDVEECLRRLEIRFGNSSTPLFPGKEIITFAIDDDKADYEEIVISIPEYRFTRETLSKDLEPISCLIESVFACDKDVVVALCAYEINGYLLDGLTFDEVCDETLMRRFPIVFKRSDTSTLISVTTNFNAQDIF
jgi:hypothetical protein